MRLTKKTMSFIEPAKLRTGWWAQAENIIVHKNPWGKRQEIWF